MAHSPPVRPLGKSATLPSRFPSGMKNCASNAASAYSFVPTPSFAQKSMTLLCSPLRRSNSSRLTPLARNVNFSLLFASLSAGLHRLPALHGNLPCEQPNRLSAQSHQHGSASAIVRLRKRQLGLLQQASRIRPRSPIPRPRQRCPAAPAAV